MRSRLIPGSSVSEAFLKPWQGTIAEMLLYELRPELLALMTTGLVAKARAKLGQFEMEAAKLKAKGLAEVAEQRVALEREMAAMQRHQEQHEGRVELNVGGVRCVTLGRCRKLSSTLTAAAAPTLRRQKQAGSSSTGTGSCSRTCLNTFVMAW